MDDDTLAAAGIHEERQSQSFSEWLERHDDTLPTDSFSDKLQLSGDSI